MRTFSDTRVEDSFCLRKTTLHFMILYCNPPAPGMTSEGWRARDRPNMIVAIRLTHVHFCNPVEVIIKVLLRLGHEDVTTIAKLRVVEAVESREPLLPIA